MALTVKVDGDGSGFSATLDKLTKEAADFASNLSTKVSGNFSQAIMGVVPGLTSAIAGIFAADSIKSFVKQFADEAHNISMGALRLNIDPQTFQRINNVMKEVGLEGDHAGIAFDHLAEAVTKIGDGEDKGHKLKRAFLDLGVTLEEIKAGNYQDLFFKIAESLHGVTPSAQQLAAMKELFGRGGVEMLPAFHAGFNGRIATTNIISNGDLEQLEKLREVRAEGAEGWKRSLNGVAKALTAVWTGIMAVGSASAWADAQQTAGERDQNAWVAQRTLEIQQRTALLRKARQEADDLHDDQAAARDKFSKTDAKKADEIDKEAGDQKERNRQDAMSPEERRLDLVKQLTAAEEVYNDAKARGYGHSVYMSEQLLRIERLRGHLGAAERAADKPHQEKSHVLMSRLGNASIGGIMLSHGGDDAKSQRAKMVSHLSNIDKKMKPEKAKPANTDYS